MKITALVAVLGVTLCLTGCFTVDTAPVKGGGEHAMVHNYGVKFFNWIPILGGNASDDAVCRFVFFRDDVTLERVQHRFDVLANGRQVECPSVDEKSAIFHTIFGVPIPYLFTYREITISGTFK